MRRFILCAGAVLALAAAPAAAQDGAIAITDIKAQAFLQTSGRWSDDLSGGKPLKNLARATSPLGEPADAVLVTLAFSGPKNAEASGKLARDLALVTVKQTKGEATKTLLYRAIGGFSFGPSGVTHRTLLLEEATCAPLEIEVKIGRSSKTQKLDLQCDEPVVAAKEAAPAKGKGKAR